MYLYIPGNYQKILVGVVPANTLKKNKWQKIETNTLANLQLENHTLLLKNLH
jgi:hypothetical protein